MPRGEHSLRFRSPWAWRVPRWGLWPPSFHCAPRVWACPPAAFWRRELLRRAPAMDWSSTLLRGDASTRTCVVLLLESARILSHGALVHCPVDPSVSSRIAVQSLRGAPDRGGSFRSRSALVPSSHPRNFPFAYCSFVHYTSPHPVRVRTRQELAESSATASAARWSACGTSTLWCSASWETEARFGRSHIFFELSICFAPLEEFSKT